MTLAERTTLLRVLTVAAVAVLTGAAVAKGMSAEAPRGRRRKARMSRNGSKRYQFTHDPDGANPEDAPERGSIEDAIDWAIESGGWVYLWGSNNEDCGAVSPEGKYIGKETYENDPRVVGYTFTHDPDGANPEDAPERGSIEDAIDWAIESGGWVYLWGYNNEDCGAVSPEGKYIGGEEYDGGGGGEEEDGDW